MNTIFNSVVIVSITSSIKNLRLAHVDEVARALATEGLIGCV